MSPASDQYSTYNLPALQTALDHLGYKCWHSTHCFGNKTQCKRWIAALDGKYLNKGPPPTRADFDAIFQRYTAVSADPPAFAFVEELVAAYPDAKVILYERDEDSWYDSFSKTVQHAMFRWDMNLASMVDSELVGPVRDMQRRWVEVWWKVRSEKEMAGEYCRDPRA
jgi:hypothetical protein